MVSVIPHRQTALLSGGRLQLRVFTGLHVADDLPGGGGAIHVGGASVAPGPRQETKARDTKQD